MSDTNNRPNSPNDTVRGDTKNIPDKGAKTGVTDSYGADLGVDAQNGKGGIDACSDGMQQGGLSKNKR